MSSHPHFPIISTTPPPLDINEDNNEDEEEEDFGSFNNVLPENEIDFNEIDLNFKKNVIQNTAKNQNLKENESVVKNESFDNRIDEIESNDKEIKSHNCINDISINCDNNIAIQLNANNDSIDEKISLKSIEFADIDCTLSAEELDTENSINYDRNSFVKNEDFEESDGQVLGNDLKVEDNKEEEFNDSFGDNNSEKLEDYPQYDNDFVDENNDFADFTSFKFTDSEEIVAAVESEKQIYAKEDQSFGDFNSSNFNNFQSNYNNSNEESDDDFADFASAEPVMHRIETVSNSNKNSSTSPSNDGEFADFSSFKDNNEIESKQEFNIQSGFESTKLSALFIETFHNSKTLDSNENPIIISRDLFHSAEPNSISLWKSVQNLEEAPSLKLRWPNSHSFQLLLAALKIDPRNILRNSSVPMFASGLGHVLEPTKNTINSDIIENPNESNESIAESTNSLSSTPIPPVQFDWSSSGLTNPLDANQKSMTPFDLDFFVTNDDVQNINKQTAISSFEEELLNDKIETNSKIDSISGDLDSTNGRTNIVQQLLSSIKSTSTPTKQISDRNQVLSAEALQVLDELPNLSFMRAKVLMFPIINIKTDSN